MHSRAIAFIYGIDYDLHMTTEQIKQLFRAEADKHGFAHVPIKTDRSRRRLGGFAHKGTEPVYFTFSAILLPLLDEAQILDTIRHEIAHAKTPCEGHGYAWKLAAVAVGAKPEACAAVEIDAKQAGYKYIAPCACSPVKHGKTRMPSRSLICGICRQRLTWIQQY
jgi:predicted SprT family Zn-dependent metalloprotease